MIMWEDKPLGSIVEVSAGQSAPQGDSNFGNDGHPFVRAGSLSSLCNGGSEGNLEHLSDEVAKRHHMRLFPKDTVLFAKSGMSATIGWVYQLSQPCYVVSHLATLMPSAEVSGRYLLHYFKKHSPANMIANSAYPSIRLSDISSKKIPLPPLSEQKRIADILDKADELREKRKQTIVKLDELLQSVFLDMFGDPVTNPKGWDVEPLGDVCDVRDGTHDSPKFLESGCPLLTSKNFSQGRIDRESVSYISKEDYDQINKRSKVDVGDIVMPMIGTIGSPVIIHQEPDFAIKNVCLIKFTSDSPSNVYIHRLLSSYFFDQYVKENNRGGTQKFLSLGIIRKMPIPVPPKLEQSRFTKVSTNCKILYESTELAGERLDNLFSSLQQKAFKGEL